MKAFHLLLFDGSLIFPKCILILGLIILNKFLDNKPKGLGTTGELLILGSPTRYTYPTSQETTSSL
ncbi:hypothetical protein PHJA_001251900 [Phtheirospermum japonicum]|uniref:NAD(P)H-quinone oxidoreductase subunit 2 N-terminal domain-containing protein n=1 Tax=Phtheirospermum japonicum TaxID=374723 RepID=A0A830BWE3_9LAMI|nr:hypothetical protein PHJA_001071500 [Phtheirospermum japonicum]GFP91079.1 hypothetical protein PHJA_001251900 [Phtheirospermum japonicum]